MNDRHAPLSNIDTEILAELEAAEQDDAAARDRLASAFMHRIRAGWRLLEKKETIPHDGHWREYIRGLARELADKGYPPSGTPYSLRWFQEWMYLAKHLPDDEKAQPVAHLGMKENLARIRRANKPKSAPVIIPGHLSRWMKIIHGDCLDILPTINRPYILMSDPPYNIGMGYDGYDDNMPEDEYQRLLIRVFKGHPAVITLDAVKAFNLLGGGILDRCEKIVAWVYNSNLPNQFRLVMWFNCKPDLTRLGQDYKNANDKRIAMRIEEGFEARLYDVWYIDVVKNVSKDHDHPCPIPVELARRIILTTTEPGDRIVDPYCGSGTIPAVAAALGRYGIGIEQSEKYCRIAEARLGTIEEELGLKDEAVFMEAAEGDSVLGTSCRARTYTPRTADTS